MSETREYKCRDIGYGVETGTVDWPATGERDWTGKRPYRRTDGVTVYLFDDELQAPRCDECGRRLADPKKHHDYVSTINGERHEMWLEPGAGTVLGPVCTGHKPVDVWTVGRRSGCGCGGTGTVLGPSGCWSCPDCSTAKRAGS